MIMVTMGVYQVETLVLECVMIMVWAHTLSAYYAVASTHLEIVLSRQLARLGDHAKGRARGPSQRGYNRNCRDPACARRLAGCQRQNSSTSHIVDKVESRRGHTGSLLLIRCVRCLSPTTTLDAASTAGRGGRVNWSLVPMVGIIWSSVDDNGATAS